MREMVLMFLILLLSGCSVKSAVSAPFKLTGSVVNIIMPDVIGDTISAVGDVAGGVASAAVGTASNGAVSAVGVASSKKAISAKLLIP